ncbi:testosterone 17-beta-dehydrogenase 3-like [Willisornis vidua]|uniref:Testosterone 17-beta-dehydrogenase 3-like n=1 Tax=Willisornis vidua TaxID=1566151 RepID=A0ABQ9CMN0_9PASS|nr:testosterone 17-beta-dehydrogenase 3-like [Willisornis vidua]
MQYRRPECLGFLRCKLTLLAHVWHFVHENSQVLLCRAALNNFFQSVLVSEIAQSQVHHFALVFIELHEVLIFQLLNFVQVPLEHIPFFCCVSFTAQLHVICKLAEGALDPSVCAIDEDIKKCQSQDRALRDNTHHQPPSECRAIDHGSLAASIQLIPYPLNSKLSN